MKIEQQLSSSTSLAVSFMSVHCLRIPYADANLPAPTICPASPCPEAIRLEAYSYPTGAALSPTIRSWNTTSWFSEGVRIHTTGLRPMRTAGWLRIRSEECTHSRTRSMMAATSEHRVATNSPAFVANPFSTNAGYGRGFFDVRNSAVINARTISYLGLATRLASIPGCSG